MRNFPKFIFSLNFLYVLLIAAQVAAIIFLCLYIPSFLPMATVYVGVWLFTAVAATVLLARRGTAEVKCAWFTLIAALPVAGAIIYLLASAKKKPCGIFTLTAESGSGMGEAARISCGTAVTGYDTAEYYECGEKLFPVLFEKISSARKLVCLEFFIICRGTVFNELIKSLKKARENGARILIIFDGVGSAFKLKRKNIRELKELGEVKIFNRLVPVPRAGLNLRDHRKIVTIDGKIAFTGGVNIADEYANISSPYGYWKDTGVIVTGATAKVFEGMFLSVWNGKYEMSFPKGGSFGCLPYYDSPPHRSFCEDAFVYAINRAEKRVHVFTPYFCVSEKTAAALAFAAKRGVDVKIIIPHVPDKKYAFEVTKTYAGELEGSGVRFFEYIPGFMHAKSLVCDDGAFIGSHNFDYRSTHFNYECGIAFNGKIAEDIESDFQSCLALSRPLSNEKVYPLKKFRRFVLKLFSPLI